MSEYAHARTHRASLHVCDVDVEYVVEVATRSSSSRGRGRDCSRGWDAQWPW